MNIRQLLDLGAIHRPLNVVINCRPDRVERNGQMGEIIPELEPDKVFVIGHPARSAIEAIPAAWRSRAVDLGGDRRGPEEFMAQIVSHLGPDSSLVAVGNIHGQGEHLLEQLAELPADEGPDGVRQHTQDGPADSAERPAPPADRPTGHPPGHESRPHRPFVPQQHPHTDSWQSSGEHP